MNKLLSAGFFRLKKNLLFWLSMVFMAIAGISFPLAAYADSQKYGLVYTLEGNFFTSAVFAVILSSVFCSLFIGADYSSGTIRNKVIAGHNRVSLYLANLVICIAACLLMTAAYSAAYLATGLPLLGTFTISAKTVMTFVAILLCLIIAASALFTVISMLIRSKASSAVTCILLAFILLFAGTYLNARLNEEEMYPVYDYGEEYGYYSSENGPPDATMIKNPNYLEGTERQVYQFLYDFLPGGQMIQCASGDALHPKRMPAYSLIIAVASTGIGLFFFRRKDMK